MEEQEGAGARSRAQSKPVSIPKCLVHLAMGSLIGGGSCVLLLLLDWDTAVVGFSTYSYLSIDGLHNNGVKEPVTRIASM